MKNEHHIPPNVSPIEHLLEIANSNNVFSSVIDYVTHIKSIAAKLTLPLFNISCLTTSNGTDQLLIFPDWSFLRSLHSSILSSAHPPQFVTLNIKRLLTNRSIIKKSMLFSILRGNIAVSDTLTIPETVSNVSIYTLAHIINEFSNAAYQYSKVITPEIKENILQSPQCGGAISFPLLSDSEVIGSFDLVYPKDKCTIDAHSFATLELVAKLIANGMRQYRYRSKIIFSEIKYNSIINAIPMAMFAINNDFTIIETNDTFKNWFQINNPLNKKCYDVIALEKTPCKDCMAMRAKDQEHPLSRELQLPFFGDSRYFRYTASPVVAPSGSISSVVNILEDITPRIIAEQKIEKFSLALADEVDKQTHRLKAKQYKLELATNTLYSLKQAHTIQESIQHIIASLKMLGAEYCIVTLLNTDGKTLQIAEVSPDSFLYLLQSVSHQDIVQTKFDFAEYAETAFFSVIKNGKSIIIGNDADILSFIETTFPIIDADNKSVLLSQFKDKILAIYPLGTHHRIEGSIAIALDTSAYEENKDYIELLLNAASVEINRRRNQEDLLKSELRYRNLVENTQDIILVCTPEGDIVYGNSVFHRLLAPQSLKQLFFDYVDEKDKHLLQSIMLHSIHSGTNPDPFEIQLCNNTNQFTWFEVAMSLVPSDHTVAVQIVAREIERKKTMEAHIQNLTEFQENILQNEMVGIITTDLNGMITSWNKGASILSGYQPFETLNTPLATMIYPCNNHFSEVNSSELLSPAEPPYSEFEISTKSGSPLATLAMSSVLHDNYNLPFAHLYFFIDISEKKRLEAESTELNQRLQQVQVATIVSLAKLAEYRNRETGMHLERIMRYVELLAHELSRHHLYTHYITREYIDDLVNSCLLHDIGKVGIPDQILLKPGRLSEYEYEIMKQHTIIGAETIAEAERKVEGRSYLNLGKEIAFYHHERWDGTGYPKGLKGEAIPLSARIVAIADVYDALVSERPYKPAYSHEKAVAIITNKSGIHFDPTIVTAFINLHVDFLRIKDTMV